MWSPSLISVYGDTYASTVFWSFQTKTEFSLVSTEVSILERPIPTNSSTTPFNPVPLVFVLSNSVISPTL